VGANDGIFSSTPPTFSIKQHFSSITIKHTKKTQENKTNIQGTFQAPKTKQKDKVIKNLLLLQNFVDLPNNAAIKCF
jgi:hypothetical protein